MLQIDISFLTYHREVFSVNTILAPCHAAVVTSMVYFDTGLVFGVHTHSKWSIFTIAVYMGWDPAVEHKTWSPGIIGSSGSSDVILGGPFSMNHKLILGKYSL